MTHVRETRARNLYVCHTDWQEDISHTSFLCVCHGLDSSTVVSDGKVRRESGNSICNLIPDL